MDLSRIVRGATPITLDRPRLLFFDMAATWLLISKYGDGYLQALYGPASGTAKDAALKLVLKSMEALQFYLWVGLQADAKTRNEELTLDEVGDFITPYTYPRIFNMVLLALGRDLANPPRAGEEAGGKADAAAARPAVAAAESPAPRSTSSKNSGSRSARSAGRPKGSGVRHSPSTTSPVRGTSTLSRRAAKKPPTG